MTEKKLEHLQQGDIFFGEVTDSQGREQKFKRPYLTLSTESFNKINGFAIILPLSNSSRSSRNVGENVDSIPVITTHSNVQGYVLTQFPCPFYGEEIDTVKVSDTATPATIQKALTVYRAIISTTDYPCGKSFGQGDILEVTINEQRKNVVVLSENSFNKGHNTTWVAPINIDANKPTRGDHVVISELSATNRYVYVLCEHIKSVDLNARDFKLKPYRLSDEEKTDCQKALDTFII